MHVFTNLKEKRMERGLTQAEAARFIGISRASYGNYEYKKIGSHNPIAQKIIASGILGGTSEDEIRETLQKQQQEERNKHRIQNIPNFYERLDELCDENGRILKNVDSKKLEALHRDLGVAGKGIRTGRAPKARAVDEQEALGKLVKKHRGKTSQRALGRLLDVDPAGISAIERGQYSSDSKLMERLVSHEFFTIDQRDELTEAYERLVAKEKGMEI